MKRNTMAKLASVLALACMWCASTDDANAQVTRLLEAFRRQYSDGEATPREQEERAAQIRLLEELAQAEKEMFSQALGAQNSVNAETYRETSSNAWDSDPQAGTRKVLTIKGVEYAFRWCPPGTFIMGSPTTEGKRRMENETQRPVTLDGFWILETEVTQEMWKSVMGTNPSYFSSSGDGSDKVSGVDTSRFPVESVSWLDFQNFVLQLNRLNVAPTGFAFRFPWEAEWEYACRAGTTGPYNVEDSSLGALGWYNGNSDERTHAVGGKLANAWGLCDMHGNVCEWCADLDGQDCQIGNGVPMRFLRGGYWLGEAELCRSAKSVYLQEMNAGKTNGCRLVLASCESWERQVNRFRQDYELLERQRAALEAAMRENELGIRQLEFEGKMQRHREKMDDLNTQRRLNALQEEQKRLDREKARNIGRF